ncbi:MAG TPA: hypothetical protein VNF49_09275 [Candidatus Binataceae bacterium]|nr:hypothetical protein [Candidatus Binataceae bacterium]
MSAFDAAEVGRAVRKEVARHEQLHDRLSRVVGPVAGYGEMTLPELAAYGLKKLRLEVPDDEDEAVTALEYFLHGRANREMGASASMDAGGDDFVSRYLAP